MSWKVASHTIGLPFFHGIIFGPSCNLPLYGSSLKECMLRSERRYYVIDGTMTIMMPFTLLYWAYDWSDVPHQPYIVAMCGGHTRHNPIQVPQQLAQCWHVREPHKAQPYTSPTATCTVLACEGATQGTTLYKSHSNLHSVGMCGGHTRHNPIQVPQQLAQCWHVWGPHKAQPYTSPTATRTVLACVGVTQGTTLYKSHSNLHSVGMCGATQGTTLYKSHSNLHSVGMCGGYTRHNPIQVPQQLAQCWHVWGAHKAQPYTSPTATCTVLACVGGTQGTTLYKSHSNLHSVGMWGSHTRHNPIQVPQQLAQCWHVGEPHKAQPYTSPTATCTVLACEGATQGTTLYKSHSNLHSVGMCGATQGTTLYKSHSNLHSVGMWGSHTRHNPIQVPQQLAQCWHVWGPHKAQPYTSPTATCTVLACVGGTQGVTLYKSHSNLHSVGMCGGHTRHNPIQVPQQLAQCWHVWGPHKAQPYTSPKATCTVLACMGPHKAQPYTSLTATRTVLACVGATQGTTYTSLTATCTVLSSILWPKLEMAKAWSQAPDSLVDTDKRWAIAMLSGATEEILLWLAHLVPVLLTACCITRGWEIVMGPKAQWSAYPSVALVETAS